MSKEGKVTEVVDSLLKFTVFGGVLSIGLIAPNSINLLEKPAFRYLNKIDKRKREREFKRILLYMKHKNLLVGDYEHGLQITQKGRERLVKKEFDEIKLEKPKKWDGKWRIVLFDIPENKKLSRDTLTRKLRNIGFYQLQKSVWLHPYECRKEIETISTICEIDKFVTYIETSYIDREDILKKMFKLK